MIVQQYADHVQVIVVVNNIQDLFDLLYKMYLIHIHIVNEVW